MRLGLGPVALLAGLAVFAGLSVPAVLLYPGGTSWDPSAPGYSFWQNFLCDLLRRVAFDGRPNPSGARFGQAALLALVGALVPFWLSSAALVDRPALAGAIRALGCLSIPAMGAVVFLPSDRFGVAVHAIAVIAAVVTAFGAAGCAVAGLFAGGLAFAGWLGAAALAVGTVDFALYAIAIATGTNGSMLTPAAQKIALLLLVAWMTVVALLPPRA